MANDLSIKIPTVINSIDSFVDDFKSGIPDRIKSERIVKKYYPLSLDVIPYGRQSIDEEDIAAVVDVLKSSSV